MYVHKPVVLANIETFTTYQMRTLSVNMIHDDSIQLYNIMIKFQIYVSKGYTISFSKVFAKFSRQLG